MHAHLLPVLALLSSACVAIANPARQDWEERHVMPPQIDTAAIVLAALEAFQTSNGAIVEVTSTLRCRLPCPDQPVEIALATFAERVGAVLVSTSQPTPPCRWSSEGTESAGRGLRLSVSPPEYHNDLVSVWAGASCVARRAGRPEPFYQATKFQAEVVEGQWRITKVLESVVS